MDWFKSSSIKNVHGTGLYSTFIVRFLAPLLLIPALDLFG
jgi:hypothetical protein